MTNDMKIRVFSSWEVTSLLQGAVRVLSPIHDGSDMLHLTGKKICVLQSGDDHSVWVFWLRLGLLMKVIC